MTQDGVSAQGHIRRIVGSDEGWAREVADPTGTSTPCDESFPTDADAYREFLPTMERAGIPLFGRA